MCITVYLRRAPQDRLSGDGMFAWVEVGLWLPITVDVFLLWSGSLVGEYFVVAVAGNILYEHVKTLAQVALRNSAKFLAQFAGWSLSRCLGTYGFLGIDRIIGCADGIPSIEAVIINQEWPRIAQNTVHCGIRAAVTSSLWQLRKPT